MMNIQELKTLLKGNFSNEPSINFTDVKSASRNALVEYFGLENLSPREIRVKQDLIMALIEEIIDEEFPIKLEERIGDFAEIKQFARDQQVIFKMNNRGRRRAMLSIKRGARGGLYEAARLDTSYFELDTYTETVGIYISLEEIILGKYSLIDLMDNILDGFVERLYVGVIEALQAAALAAPAANQESGSGVVLTSLDKVIRVVSAYGKPVIMGFRSLISQINNGVGSGLTPNLPISDIEDIKRQGFVSIYKGSVPVIELPNYIVNEVTNDEWLLEEKYLFVLPVDTKPVKVALKGDLYFKETVHPSGSVEQNAHKILGVGVVLNNNIGIYEDSGSEDEDNEG